MKQTIILWFGAILITLLAGYLNSVNSPYYPFSSTIGVEGKKVSFYVERKQSSEKPVELIIRTDIDSISGFVFWKENGKDWNKSKLEYIPGNKILKTEISPSKPKGTKDIYFSINRNYKEYRYPPEGSIKITFFGELKRGYGYTYFIFLFAAILISARAGLEVFRNKKLKALFIFATIGQILWALFLVPIKNTFELMSPGDKILPISELFDIIPLIIVSIWIVGLIGIFNTNRKKEFALGATILSIALFIFYN